MLNWQRASRWTLPALAALLSLTVSTDRSVAFGATIVVAASDASEKSKATADYVCDGSGDQEEINAAIEALPEVGGLVLLTEGRFDIRRIDGELGGVLIKRSHVVLAGSGSATRLTQAAAQETNVIRIIGPGIGFITIRDLVVDANRDENPIGEGDRNVSHARFEFCGIKGFCQVPGKTAMPLHDITIRNTHVLNARRLGIMLEGRNMRVIENVLGNAMSDSVEILTGPGEIRGNTFEITGRTHVAAGTDRANSIIMAENIVHVRKGGDLDIGFRSWSQSQRHVIANNIVTVDPGGTCRFAMDIRGFGAAVTGNVIHASDPDKPLTLRISAGNTLVANNVFENVVIEVDDKTERNKPIMIHGNLLENSRIDWKKGNLNGKRTHSTGPSF
ncbi:MAG: hypothetical protein ACC628_18520 [Pirellulaceae bacterium]